VRWDPAIVQTSVQAFLQLGRRAVVPESATVPLRACPADDGSVLLLAFKLIGGALATVVVLIVRARLAARRRA
jgi:hypothetical protein